MYNTCLWTVKKSTKNKIDATQRKLLRKALNIKWPNKISNHELMQLTQQQQWSDIIQQQRIRWLGHALRLPEDSPCKQAIQEYKRPVNKPRGRPITTCYDQVLKELSEKHVDINKLEEFANNRSGWRRLCQSSNL